MLGPSPTDSAVHRPALGRGWVDYWPLVLAIVMRVASTATSDLSYVVLAAYALGGRANLLRALAMSWLFTTANSGLVPDAPLAAAGRYLVLLAAAVSAILHAHVSPRQIRETRLEQQTFLLGLFMVAHAWLFSPLVDVSILKAVSWTVTVITSILAWRGLRPEHRGRLSNEFFWGLALVMAVSLPLAGTSIGYLANGTGLQGILNQPQTFGATMALLCAWSTARLLGQARPSWWLLLVAGLSLQAILMSEARVAGLSTVLGVVVALLLGPLLTGKPMLAMAPGLRSARLWIVLFSGLLLSLILAATFSALVMHYLSKSGRSDVGGLWDAYELSRGGLIGAMIENIAENPWKGIGFGIASNPDAQIVSRDPFLGLPIGSSIEKGVTPLMVLEELGIIGAALVGFWVLRLLRAAASGGLSTLAVFSTTLMLNFGEATLFSPGGFGLLPLILIGWTYAQGQGAAEQRHG